MYTIQLNEKGSHNLQITEKNLETIDRYALFRDLVDSSWLRQRSRLRQAKIERQSLDRPLYRRC